MIPITGDISIGEDELRFHFVRSSGPGGQNVNKVASAAELRFDVTASRSLPAEVKQRLRNLAGRAVDSRGVLLIDARRFRSQAQNRQDAIERLADLIRRAAVRPRKRIRTRPTAGAQRRRRVAKARRSEIKSLRGRVREE